jgi:hypothetical protein
VEYLSDDKLSSLTLVLHDNMKFSFLIKNQQEADALYEQIRDALP